MLNLTRLAWGLAVPILFLSCVGLAAINATDRSIGAKDATLAPPSDSETDWLARARTVLGSNTIRQTAYLLTGVGWMLLVTRISYRRIGDYAFVIYWIVIAMLALLVLDKYVDVPLIPVSRNVRRWIDLGFMRLQPSEFMKMALILALARYLRFRDSYRRLSGLIPPFLMTLLPMALIEQQPDLGTLLMLLPVLFAMLFVAGARLRHLGSIVALGLIIIPFYYAYGMQDYQRERIDVVIKQNSADESWHMSKGYQLRQSKMALALGGFFGQGYRQGDFVRYALLPEEHNDFIFAIVGNQWGMLGGILVLLSYVMIVVFGLEVAIVTNDPLGRLLAVGVVVMIVAQALLNICMTIGLAPITGMTLPFVSFGGSSIWTNFIAMGLLVNVAQRRLMLIAKPPFEHAD